MTDIPALTYLEDALVCYLASVGAVCDTRAVSEYESELYQHDTALTALYRLGVIDYSIYGGWYLTPVGAAYALRHGVIVR